MGGNGVVVSAGRVHSGGRGLGGSGQIDWNKMYILAMLIGCCSSLGPVSLLVIRLLLLDRLLLVYARVSQVRWWGPGWAACKG